MTSYVYRCLDSDSALLYVGVTDNVDRRMAQHAAWAAWFSRCESWTITPYPTRDEATKHEAEAIKAEAPRFNVTFSGKPRDRAGVEMAHTLVQELSAEVDRQGVSQSHLALAAGIAQPNLSRKMRMQREFHLGEFLALCESLGVSLEELARRAETSTKGAA